MPKPKTKSSAKKRFKPTAEGKVLRAHAGKRRGMIKRINEQICDKRGLVPMNEADAKKVHQQYLPHAE